MSRKVIIMVVLVLALLLLLSGWFLSAGDRRLLSV